jgi:hypothetical protein
VLVEPDRFAVQAREESLVADYFDHGSAVLDVLRRIRAVLSGFPPRIS